MQYLDDEKPVDRSVKRNSFYGGMESGTRPEIDMPPLDAQSPIMTAAPDPWGNQEPQAQSDSVVAPVPDHVPRDVEYEAAPEEQAAEESTEEVQAKPRASQKESSTASNMRALREAREKAERERDDLMRLLQLQAQQQNKPQEKHVHEEPEVDDYPDIELDPESLADGKHINQLAKQIKQDRKAMKALRAELNSYKSQSSEALVESRIKAQFPDFDKVVSRENVDVLNETYPELARTLRDTTDVYSKAVSAYKVIKQFGIHRDDTPDPDRARAIKNAAKPRPLASVNPQQGDTPLSRANAFANGEFTSEMKDKLRREMAQARKDN